MTGGLLTVKHEPKLQTEGDPESMGHLFVGWLSTRGDGGIPGG